MLATVNAYAGQGADYVNSYFEIWLKDHKFTDFVKRKDGIHFENEFKPIKLSDELHWAKLVVSNVDGKVELLTFTLDGYTWNGINQKLEQYHWPKAKTYYMAKFFFVIGRHP